MRYVEWDVIARDCGHTFQCVIEDGERIVVTLAGEPVAALIPIADYPAAQESGLCQTQLPTPKP